MDWLTIATIAGVASTPVLWLWRSISSWRARIEERHEKLRGEFHDYKMAAAERFATTDVVHRLETKIDVLGDRITKTIVDLFRHNNE